MASLSGIRGLQTFIEIGLTATLAILIGTSVWPLFASPTAGSASSSVLAPQVAFEARAENPDTYGILTRSNPFSKKVDAQAIANASTLDAPETSLNLVLKGSRAAGDQQGIAVIQLPDNRQIRAEIGDEILNDVVLEYIFAGRVTLRRNGRLENLFMRDTEGETSVILPARTGPVEGARASTPRADAPETANSSVQSVSVTKFWRNVQLQTIQENGRRSGYRVLPRGDADVLLAAGFEPNDVIQAVNGTPIYKLDSRALQQLMSSNAPVQFDVDRDGLRVRVQTGFRQEEKK